MMTKIMKNKKEYTAPKSKLIEIKYKRPLLLDGSTNEFGLAPNEQNPIA